MATKKDSSTALTLRVATGTSDSGKTIFANRTVSDINPALTDEDFCAVGAGLASLQANVLSSVIRTDKSTFELD